MNTSSQTPLELGAISSGGFALFRERAGFYVGLTVLLFGPGYVIMMVSQAMQLEWIIPMYAAMFRGQMPNMANQPIGATLLAYLGYAVMLGGYVIFQSAIAAAGIAQLRGQRLSIVDALKAGGIAPLWVTFFDVPYLIVLTLGLVCCFVPGAAIALLVAAVYPYVNAVLVDQKLNVFEAMSKSADLSVGDRGTHAALVVLFFCAYLVYSFVMVGFMGLLAFAATDGFTDVHESSVLMIVVGMTVLSVLSYPLTTALWAWMHLARVHAYFTKVYGDPRARGDLERVFA